MQQVPKAAVRQWVKIGKANSPKSAGMVCPHCGERVVFSLTGHSDDKSRLAILASGACPGCTKKVHFFSFRSEASPQDDDNNPEAIYSYPPAKNHYPYPELAADIPDGLNRSLVSTVEAFNSQNYAATAVCCRRTLEGIFKYLLPEEKRGIKLHRAIVEVQEHTDLAAPLSSLSHAIREGGNLGAHFDMEKEPSAEMAKQMVDLVVYLISFLYVLPEEIQALEASLGDDA